MTSFKNVWFRLGLVGALAASGCVTSEDGTGEQETSEAASTVCREIQHFTYRIGNTITKWDLTTETTPPFRQFVDEKRPGFYQQYRVSPVWSDCPHANEWVNLLAGPSSISGIHVCLPDGRQEFHGSDFQRLLAPQGVTSNCQP